MNPDQGTGDVAAHESGHPPAAGAAAFDWCIVEIFGHRRHAGRGREEEKFGSKMLRIDVPVVLTFDVADPAVRLDPPKVEWTTHYYGGSSIFSFTLTDEATVMAMSTPNVPLRYRLAAPEVDDDDLQFEDELAASEAPGT